MADQKMLVKYVQTIVLTLATFLLANGKASAENTPQTDPNTRLPGTGTSG